MSQAKAREWLEERRAHASSLGERHDAMSGTWILRGHIYADLHGMVNESSRLSESQCAVVMRAVEAHAGLAGEWNNQLFLKLFSLASYINSCR